MAWRDRREIAWGKLISNRHFYKSKSIPKHSRYSICRAQVGGQALYASEAWCADVSSIATVLGAFDRQCTNLIEGRHSSKGIMRGKEMLGLKYFYVKRLIKWARQLILEVREKGTEAQAAARIALSTNSHVRKMFPDFGTAWVSAANNSLWSLVNKKTMEIHGVKEPDFGVFGADGYKRWL